MTGEEELDLENTLNSCVADMVQYGWVRGPAQLTMPQVNAIRDALTLARAITKIVSEQKQ